MCFLEFSVEAKNSKLFSINLTKYRLWTAIQAFFENNYMEGWNSCFTIIQGEKNLLTDYTRIVNTHDERMIPILKHRYNLGIDRGIG